MLTTSEEIKALRDKAGLTQQQLADKLGIKQQKISEWEKGMYEPRYSTVIKIKEICKLPE